ncbi:helix-hairpin-helix domain-containing protein [Chloroflexota bacterium]
MATSKLDRFWKLLIIFLVAVIVTGGIVIWSRYSHGQPVEISIPQGQEWQGSIYIDGSISNPGFYPFTSDDSLEDLIQTAGGIVASANLSGLELHVSGSDEEEAQKVDINRAEVWLLKALPGIGETIAQRIVDYRRQNGLFRNTNELLKVSGIGTTTYEQIKDLITVAD